MVATTSIYILMVFSKSIYVQKIKSKIFIFLVVSGIKLNLVRAESVKYLCEYSWSRFRVNGQEEAFELITLLVLYKNLVGKMEKERWHKK